MAGAGLGLRLHDKRHNTDHHAAAFEPWWVHAREHYLDLARGGAPETVSLYYDPLLDVHHKLPALVGMSNCFYLAPQVPEETRRLFDAAVVGLGITDDGVKRLDLHRSVAIAWFLAREWGIDDLDQRLAQALNDAWEPTWDRSLGEFTWGLALDEEYPRGQFNAFLGAAEAVSPGAWQQTTEVPLPDEPLVVGVDFPSVALSEARWIDGRLRLRMAPMNDAVVGEPTSFAVVGLDDPSAWNIDGSEGSGVVLSVRVDGADAVRISTEVGYHGLELYR